MGYVHECDNPACDQMVDTDRLYWAQLLDDGTVHRFCSEACHTARYPIPPDAIVFDVIADPPNPAYVVAHEQESE